jgi:small subunit ribosomal protein S9
MAEQPQDPQDEPREDEPREDEVAEPAAPEEAPEPAPEAPAEPPEAPSPEEVTESAAEQPAEAAAEEEPGGAAEEPAAEEAAAAPDAAAAARAKPEIPGADLEVDIVPEGVDPLAPTADVPEAELVEVEPEPEPPPPEPPEEEEPAPAPVPRAAIDLAADARYRATGKRKTAVARVILKPGSGSYHVNGRPLDEHFPRPTLQRNIRQPLETVGYDGRMDVVATLHGGGVSAQAGALRHGIARALIEADPNLRIELKRRGFLTRDPRVKERKKAGLKKARKRPQFSKR